MKFLFMILLLASTPAIAGELNIVDGWVRVTGTGESQKEARREAQLNGIFTCGSEVQLYGDWIIKQEAYSGYGYRVTLFLATATFKCL